MLYNFFVLNIKRDSGEVLNVSFLCPLITNGRLRNLDCMHSLHLLEIEIDFIEAMLYDIVSHTHEHKFVPPPS